MPGGPDGLENRTDDRQHGRAGAGHRPGDIPAASTIFTDTSEYGLSSSQYGAMFLPQVALAIAASLLGSGLARRIYAKRVYLLGLACSIVAMVLLLASTLTPVTVRRPRGGFKDND